jgi:hypothetical protein
MSEVKFLLQSYRAGDIKFRADVCNYFIDASQNFFALACSILKKKFYPIFNLEKDLLFIYYENIKLKLEVINYDKPDNIK